MTVSRWCRTPPKGTPLSQQLNPYITFNGDCADAMAFYGQALGGEPQVMTFRQAGMEVDGIMHASLDTPASFHIFASDYAEGMGEYQPGTNVQVSISGDDEDALRGYWAALSEGGQFVDKFGIIWHINIAGPANA